MTSPRPRRRHSAAVYRRRRAVLFITLLVVALGAWALIAQPWRAQAGAPGAAPRPSTTTPAASPPSAPTPSPAPPESPAPTPSAAPAPGPTSAPCRSGDVVVEAVTDRGEYAAGENPQLSIRLTNNGPDCVLNVGTAAQVFTITSGTDTWWRSTDCQTEPSDMIVLLTAGQSVSSATPLTWDRTRSAVDTCGGERPAAPGGAATYQLSVSIGGIASTQPASFLLY